MPIEVQKLTHIYWPQSPFARKALNEVDLRIEDGEIIGVLGSNGSGKSTLGLILAGLIQPTAGRVFFDEQLIYAKGFNLGKLHQKTGYLFQNPEHQMLGLKVIEEISYSLRKAGMVERQISQKVADICTELNLDFISLKNREVFSLSRGQMRYVAIASLLTMDPQVLILDEPTAGLDYQGVENFLSVLKKLNSARGITIIFISHQLHEVLKIADRLIFLERGKVYLDFDAEEIFQRSQELITLGIPEPDLIRIIKNLQCRGFKLNNGILSEDQLVEELLSSLEEKFI